MTPVYTVTDPQLGRVEYRDRKRWWWLLSVVYPLLPFAGMAAQAGSGQQIALGLPLLISYGLMPLLDYLLGEDKSNPPEAVVPQLEGERYYRWLTWLTVPLHFVALIGCAWWVGTHELSWWAVLMLAYIAGTDSGLGINTGHELGHKYTRIEQWLARLVLAVPAYGHFTVEHGRGHHRWVSTPQDHASARMGENIYRFALRELPGGQYEAPQPHHSWNANHVVTNLALFHLQRHSDHHAHPSRRYQSLRHFPDLPQLPSGYFGMFPLAYIPPLWFRVMDPRLLALPHVRGDLSKVNIDPKKREGILARYGVRDDSKASTG